jgi:hypothetical protein
MAKRLHPEPRAAILPFSADRHLHTMLGRLYVA